MGAMCSQTEPLETSAQVRRARRHRALGHEGVNHRDDMV